MKIVVLRFVLPILIIVLSSCAGVKLRKEQERMAAAEAVRPTWTKETKNVSNGYYWGLGIAQKKEISGTMLDCREQCRREALTQIARIISVNVDAQTVLTTGNISDEMRQDFMQTVKLVSQTELDGVELAESYEDEFFCFSLYRLSVKLYEEQRRRKTNTAIEQAISFMEEAGKFRIEHDYRNALVFYLKALGAVSLYWKDKLETSYKGKVINPLVEIDRQLTETLHEIELVPIEKNIRVATGATISADKCGFSTSSTDKVSINNLPLRLYAEGLLIPITQGVTKNGLCTFTVRSSPSHSKKASISAVLDMATIMREAQLSETLKQLTNRYRLPEAQFYIIRVAGSVFISCADENSLSTYAKNELGKQLLRQDVEISEQNNNNLPTVRIETQGYEILNKGTYFTLQATIQLAWIDKNGKSQKHNINLRESAVSEEETNRQILKTMSKEIKNQIAGKIYFSIF